jgi:hypothetical protein
MAKCVCVRVLYQCLRVCMQASATWRVCGVRNYVRGVRMCVCSKLRV